MEQDRTKRYLAYGAGILVLCFLFALNDARALKAAKARGDAQREGSTSISGEAGDDSAKSGKSTARTSAPKPATDKEVEKFSRFFLPPIKLEGATIDEAVAAILAAYRETAAATGETALDLRVDLAAARTRKPITTTTPRAPAGDVIRYVAVLAGNRTKGSLPNFRLEALSDQANRSGTLTLPPGWGGTLRDYFAALDKASEAKLGEDPFAPPVPQVDPADDPFASTPPTPDAQLREVLLAQGFNPGIECKISGSKFSYGTMSEAEQEWLNVLLETTSRGPIQVKTDTKVLMVPEALADSLSSGTALGAEDVQLNIRKFAQTEGVDLMTLPNIIARTSQSSIVELINTAVTPEGTETWTGVKMATSAVPYGLGSQVEFAFESRAQEGGQSQARERIILPENGNGVAVTPAGAGQKLVILQGNTMVDATGRPLSGPR